MAWFELSDAVTPLTRVGFASVTGSASNGRDPLIERAIAASRVLFRDDVQVVDGIPPHSRTCSNRILVEIQPDVDVGTHLPVTAYTPPLLTL
jgi:hypothetical protein